MKSPYPSLGSQTAPMPLQNAFHRVCQSIAAKRQMHRRHNEALKVWAAGFERVKQSANR